MSKNRTLSMLILAILMISGILSGCNKETEPSDSGATVTTEAKNQDETTETSEITKKAEPQSTTENSEESSSEATETMNPKIDVWVIPERGGQMEAEDGILEGVKVLDQSDGFSGSGYVGQFEDNGTYVECAFEVEKTAVYDIKVGYLLPTDSGSKVNSIYVDDKLFAAATFEAGDGFKEKNVGPIHLDEGQHTLRFIKGEKDWGWMSVDYFKLSPSKSIERLHYEPTDQLIDKKATSETLRLYSYLRSEYGKRIFSGQQMYFPEETEIKAIQEMTGKKPAIKGYDLLNKTEGGSPDDQVERAIKWVKEENGILTLCWHWGAPSGGRAFYTDDTTFDIRKAVEEGTEEYDLIIRDIDQIAEVLLDLQQQGIPVIWRPLHEASGGWFWWGAHGPEPYQQLWKILYRRLVDYHDIHNLIWVANAQDPDWYVGNAWADMNGEDIYPDAHQYSAHLPRFMDAFNTVDGTKIIAMTENGTMPDIDEMVKSGAMWLWFMPWWGEFTETEKYTELEQWKKVYQSEYVITLEDLPEHLYAEPLLTPETENTYEADELVAKMQPGWNMGNTLDAINGETSWGNPPVTQELIKTIKRDGFNSIRIPITWNHSTGPGPDYRIDPTYMKRTQEVVDWALDEGLIVMINMHHDSAWLHRFPEERTSLQPKFEAMWAQIAEAYKDYPDELIMEPINEPRFSDDWQKETAEYFDNVDLLNDIAYRAIRKSGGNNAHRMIVMETLVAGVSETKLTHLHDYIVRKKDPYLIASVHYYGFYPFSVNIGKTTFTEEAVDDVDHTVDMLYSELISEGIPVIIGEYGLLGFDTHTSVIQKGEILKYIDYLVSRSQELGITTVLWDNGQHLDREAYTWRMPELHATILQGVKGRSSQTEQDTIYISKNTWEEGASTTLILNGNKLSEIKDGETVLKPGEDYVVEGEQLSFPKDSLEKLLNEQTFDRHAVNLVFSDGPDWTLNLQMTGKLSADEAKITDAEIFIPLRLEGHEIERVQALNASGASAGLNGWASHLQYAKDWDINDRQELVLFGEPFKQLQTSDLRISIETWAGQTIELTVAKEN